MSRYSYDSSNQTEKLIAGTAYFDVLAPTEQSPATSAWTVGRTITYNGVLYDVIAPIAVGDTLTIGTNISPSDYVMEKVDDLVSKQGDLTDLTTTAKSDLVDAINEVDNNVDDLNETLTNEVTTRATLGAHNLLDPMYIADSSTLASGVKFTNNGNGTVTLTQTASSSGVSDLTKSTVILADGTYKVTVKNAERVRVLGYTSSWVTLADSNSDTVTITATSTYSKYLIQIGITSGTTYNTTLYPMIYLATDTYTEWTPFAAPNKDLLSYKDNGVLGAKNLFDIKSLIRSPLQAGINFQLNDDGSVTIESGTTTAEFILNDAYSNAYGNANTAIPYNPGTKYIFSIGNNKHQTNIYLQVYVRETASTSWHALKNVGNVDSIEFTTPSTIFDLWIRIEVPPSKSITTTTIYPMVRLASDPDSTYVPYAMTNKELTDVAVQEIGNYIYKGQYSVSAVADGTKDYETMLNEAATAMLNKLQALADDEIAFIKQVSVNSNTSPIITKMAIEFKNNATSFDIDYSKVTINTSANIDVMWGRFNTTKSGVRCASESLTTGGSIPAPTDLRSTVPSSGGQFNIYYYVYKKIS